MNMTHTGSKRHAPHLRVLEGGGEGGPAPARVPAALAAVEAEKRVLGDIVTQLTAIAAHCTLLADRLRAMQ